MLTPSRVAAGEKGRMDGASRSHSLAAYFLAVPIPVRCVVLGFMLALAGCAAVKQQATEDQSNLAHYSHIACGPEGQQYRNPRTGVVLGQAGGYLNPYVQCSNLK
jgi:hypothetical protein